MEKEKLFNKKREMIYQIILDRYLRKEEKEEQVDKLICMSDEEFEQKYCNKEARKTFKEDFLEAYRELFPSTKVEGTYESKKNK